jgi:hypothetical protein
MKGTALIYRPGAEAPQAAAIGDPAEVAHFGFLQKHVGGYIEIIPHFVTIEHEGTKHRCVAFCNEDGKRLELPPNPGADRLWEKAMGVSLRGRDYLVGTIVVVYGDADFMAAL